MTPRPYIDPRTGRDEPPRGWKVVGSVGPGWADLPRAWWGQRDVAVAAALYQPLNDDLPPPSPVNNLPPGFSLFPGRGARETAGDRALREIRGAKANHALSKLGVHR